MELERRHLGGDGDFALVDKDGKELDPDSLAWRYLGLFMDCDAQDDEHSDDQGQADGGSSSSRYCRRKLLWAAYVDRRYRGNGVEEYQIYDPTLGEWDSSTCSRSGVFSGRCAKLDCHEPDTRFELIGVYKETNGMYDWWEQLFKHEGYCVWNDNDAYQTMTTWMKVWPDSCQLLDITDNGGNALYLDLMPLSGGDMKLAIYKDSTCSKVSSMDYATYTKKYYKSLGYRDRTGYNVARTYAEAIDTWNARMNSFKVCQPCIAYNVGGNNNNCDDKAGYTNVDQCYKFGTKTKLEVADDGDLIAASTQGSILRINVYNKVYGKGGFAIGTSFPMKPLAAVAVVGLAIGLLLSRQTLIRRDRQRRRRGSLLKESFVGDKLKRSRRGERTMKRGEEDTVSSYEDVESPNAQRDKAYAPPSVDEDESEWAKSINPRGKVTKDLDKSASRRGRRGRNYGGRPQARAVPNHRRTRTTSF
ncbi:hypothetical protein ACHAXA_009141 [Cyclostephanos tholiformis]|jgi:hypothetical protein|uniref:Uncharacterized protein n=1 Tax=Cyclostephanos tholiformis TaxID=382380 RepID=A0ABD3RWU3_9STRA